MASHEFLDHTGEMVLLVRADTLDQLFAEAARALGELERGGIPIGEEVISRRCSQEAQDLPSLFVDWLNELIYLSETEAAVPRRATVRVTEPAGLEADLVLVRLGRRPSLIKAATHHRLRLGRERTGWVAEVILDV